MTVSQLTTRVTTSAIGLLEIDAGFGELGRADRRRVGADFSVSFEEVFLSNKVFDLI